MQMDLQYNFKGVSEEFQISGSSIIGQFNKKSLLMEGYQQVLEDRGTFMTTIMKELQCVELNAVTEENEPVYLPCGTLENIESTTGVLWHGNMLREHDDDSGKFSSVYRISANSYHP